LTILADKVTVFVHGFCPAFDQAAGFELDLALLVVALVTEDFQAQPFDVLIKVQRLGPVIRVPGLFQIFHITQRIGAISGAHELFGIFWSLGL
jgi:hypothetical protein